MTETTPPSKAELADIIQQLTTVARTLEQIAHQLANQVNASSEEGQTVRETERALGDIASQLAHTEQAVKAAQERQATQEQQRDLRRAVLRALYRRGAMLPIEVAAATLSMPEEIRPVLQELAQEGLIEIHEGRRGRWISLTAYGHEEAKRLTHLFPGGK